MINSNKSHRSSSENQSQQKPLRARLGRLFDFTLVLGALVLLFFTGSYAYKMYSGVSLEDPHPKFSVRLQISNASGQSGLEKPLARQWGGYSNPLVAIEVVDQVALEGRSVPESFIILREENKELGKVLAETFGLPETAVVVKPIESDNHQVTATLVVGKNWASALRKVPPKEIKQNF
jgi:hypothetical protein